MNNATARPTRPATARPAAATTTARYARTAATVPNMGHHPVLVRLADGLMVPCTGSPARRGEPVCPLPTDWTGRTYTRGGVPTTPFAKPLMAGHYTPTTALVPVTAAAVVAAADRAFGFA